MEKNMRKSILGSFILAVMMLTAVSSLAAQPVEIPVKNMVTMVDLGAGECIPCKMMAPILEKLKKQYDGRAAIVFIDVWEERSQSRRFGISAIPTQIFYDRDGREIYRHEGFLGEDAIVSMLKDLGVAQPVGR
jgi:thioredoxin 1